MFLLRRTNRSAVTRLGASLSVALFVYGATLWLTETWWFGQERREVRRMTWQERGEGDGQADAEVVLTFADHPSHFVVVRSAKLAAHLRDRASDTVDVAFRVTRDLGCLRGTSVREVAQLALPVGSELFVGRAGPGAPEPESPWGSDPFWCP